MEKVTCYGDLLAVVIDPAFEFVCTMAPSTPGHRFVFCILPVQVPLSDTVYKYPVTLPHPHGRIKLEEPASQCLPC